MGTESLSRSERIRKRAGFQAVQNRGKKLHTERFLVFLLPQETPGPTRMGVTVSRKVGEAAQRNRVKRLVREAFRRHKALFPQGVDLVFVAKKNAVGASYQQVAQEIETLCGRYFKR